MRSLNVIAQEVMADWKNWRNSYASEYLKAMATLTSIDDNYYYDSGKSIVLYFLANVQSWRGETAKRIKQELKDMCKN